MSNFQCSPVDAIYSQSQSSGLGAWITTLFTDVGLSDPFLCTLIYAAAAIPGNLVSLQLVSKLGSKLDRATLRRIADMSGASRRIEVLRDHVAPASDEVSARKTLCRDTPCAVECYLPSS